MDRVLTIAGAVVITQIPVSAAEMVDARLVGGVVVRIQGTFQFVSADTVHAIAPAPATTQVAGTSVGIALLGGRIALVLPLGEPTSTALLCDVDGDPMVVTGAAAVATGYYERVDDGVIFDGQVIPTLDIVERYRQVERLLLSPSDPRSSPGGQ
jgi:hypothetical protein